MATLYFKVSSDWEQVVKLRQECERLEAQLKKMDVNKSPTAAKALETQLASTRQQMMGLVTEAAKAGAMMENDLKKKLNSASKASDELTEEIIKQRKIIRDTQDDVRRLSDEYSKMSKYSPNSKAKLAELNAAKAALNEQRYSIGELQDQQARNRLEVRKLTREYKEFASGTNNADEIVKSLTDSLKRTALEIGGLAAIKKFGSDVIEATGKMQQLQVALSTILQDKSKAEQLIADIVQFAAKTQFNLDDVATGAKQLLAYGSSADNVVNELSMLGDVASGLQIPIGQLIYLYGTLRTQGRAMTVDIRQFAGRGIPIYEELAKVLGVSKDQVGELVKEGKVGFKEVEQAFKNMTSEGGKFANLMESSAGTWPQRLSNIEDTLFQKMNEFGNKYKEVFEFGIGTAEDLVESLDDVLSIMGGLIAAYGTYKAALITAAVAQKAVGFVESIQLIGMYRKELGLATAAQQAFNVASKSNVYVTLLAALVGIGTAVYMFTKRTNEATVAQETLNSVNKKADEEFSKQAATVDRLSGVLKSETSSIDQKKKALSDLQTIIPSYNASLDEEGRLINNNTEAIKSYLTQLEKQIRMKAAQEELEELYRKKRTQEKQQKVATENYNEAKSLYNSSVTMTGSALQNRGVNTGVAVFSQNSAVNNQLKDSANKAKKELDSVNKELGETVSAIKELEKEIEKSSLSDKKEAQHSTISEEVENATIRIKTLKQEIADLRSGKLQAEAGKTVESAIKAKEKELQSAEKTLETLTGVSHKSENKKVVDNQQNLSDELLQLIRANQQEEINLMEEGSEKKRRQIELDYQREIDEIRKQRKKWEDAQGGKLTSEQREVLGSRASNAMTSREKGLAEITETENQAAIEANERYLKSYGTFLQKRDAIIRNIFVTTDASFSGNYQINAIAKTQGSNGGNNISALADEIYNIFGLHVDGYLSVRLEALTQIIDTFGGIKVYVPQEMDYGGSHLSQGYQTMDGAAAEFFLRTRHIYADSDLGRLRMQRYFYAALFARMRSMTVWDIAKLLPVITSQMETDLSSTELVSVAVSMLKISSSNIMFCQIPVYMGQAISYNGNSTVVVARQETADLLNEYFRENTGPVDASQLNIAGDDGLFDLSGLTASDPSVQFMGTLNEEISNAQQTNNIDGSDTTDVYDTATPAPDDSTDGDSTDGDSTPSE